MRSMATGPTAPVKNARPSYAQIHARPLPVDVHPLPLLIPHNPLSILHVGFVFFRQLLFPPATHRKDPYRGYFSPETRSVHVTEERSIRGLWEEGFFGKGILSRSEPSWLHREKRRLGITVEETAEEITARRRAERKAFKQERARKEREDIEAQHRNGKAPEASQDQAASGPAATMKPSEESHKASLLALRNESQEASKAPLFLQDKQRMPATAETSTQSDSTDKIDPLNQEHLQLDLVETFFLVYALGTLKVYSSTTKEQITTDELFRLSFAHSSFPSLTQPLKPPHPAPDHPFLLEYVVYHHYRSLGWVVRSGVKFGVDILLYQRGPAFAHAEFAIAIKPVYLHPYWQTEEAALAYGPRSRKPWHWLHMINRVQAQVRKTLLLCFVSVPPPLGPEFHTQLDIGKILRQYEVREILIRRWVPNRSRD